MATYKIVSHGGNGLPLNVETTSTISGRTNVNIWKDTGSNDQKWSINSLGTSQQVRTLNNTAYMLNAYRTNWNCDVYTSNSDTYVNFVSQGNNVYLIQLNSDKTKYLTATGTASGSNVVWQARNTSSAAQKWKISKLSDLNISNLKIFQTYTSPGKSADGSVAPDMTYNDKTKSQLLSLSPVLSDEAYCCIVVTPQHDLHGTFPSSAQLNRLYYSAAHKQFSGYLHTSWEVQKD